MLHPQQRQYWSAPQPPQHGVNTEGRRSARHKPHTTCRSRACGASTTSVRPRDLQTNHEVDPLLAAISRVCPISVSSVKESHHCSASCQKRCLLNSSSFIQEAKFRTGQQARHALQRGHLPQTRIANEGPSTWLTPTPLNLDDAQSAFAKQSSAAMLRSTSVSFLSTIKVFSLLTALQHV